MILFKKRILADIIVGLQDREIILGSGFALNSVTSALVRAEENRSLREDKGQR